MFKESLTSFKNFKKLVKYIHVKKPNCTKEDIRYGIYITLNDIYFGITNFRKPLI